MRSALLRLPFAAALALLAGCDPGSGASNRAPPTTPAVNLAGFDARDPAAAGLVLTFHDEFDALSAAEDGPAEGRRWTTQGFWESPGTYPRDALRIEGGMLVIEARRGHDGWSRGGFLSSIDSRGFGFSQRYGYFEARIKIPRGQGGFPAFWLMSTPHAQLRAEPASELDIMEAQTGNTRRYWGTIHRDSDDAHRRDRINHNHEIHVDVDLSADFHVYGLLWAPGTDTVTWYLDGKPVITAPKFDTTDGAPMMVNINFGTGGWDGPPDASTPSPLEMRVDYVRVYQFPELLRSSRQ
jgi:hypothetical protein